MTAPTPRPSPKGAGVKGKAALRVGTLQAFPRLPRLGQSPRVTSNPVMRGRGKPRCDYVKGTPPFSFQNPRPAVWVLNFRGTD